MGGDALTGVEKLHHLFGQPCVDLSPAKRMGHRVEMFLNLYVIVDTDHSSAPPILVLVSLRG
jgi:hypothetical protein